MFKRLSAGLIFIVVFVNAVFAAKPRIIISTDGEIDDKCSMVRLLLCADEFDIEGLIYSSSIFHSVENGNWAGTDWIQGHVDKYAQVVDNLKKHDPGYPSAAVLNSRIFVGNIASAGDMRDDTPGSDRIVEILREHDDRPVFLLVWSGNNTVARALKKIQQNYPQDIARICKKARLIFTLNQDNTLHDYIWPNWPNLTTVGAYGCWKGIGYATKIFLPAEKNAYYSNEWMLKNVTGNHGALCSHRPNASAGLFVGEGDSVTFLYAFPNGLRGTEMPSYGSWGGRYENTMGHANWWGDALDDSDVSKTVWRWVPAYQNELAARADWCIKDRDQTNHPPVVKLNHKQNLTSEPGQKIELSASATDPDGDGLTCKWWYYNGPSTYIGTPTISNEKSSNAVLTVPADACEGDTIHVICEVTDDGTPPLTRYQQVKVTVTSGAKPTAPQFVLGVNFDGSDTVIDGNAWRGMKTAQAEGLSIAGASTLARPETPVPAPDANTIAMLRSTITAKGDFSLAQTLPNGEYCVYLWVFEWGDFYWSFARVFDVAMEGKTLGRNVGAMKTMAWRKYGPFPVSVTDGCLNIDIKQKSREPHLAGMSIYRVQD